MLATHFSPGWQSIMAWSIPAITVADVPDPRLLRTLTAHNFPQLATPYVSPQIVPATWVLRYEKENKVYVRHRCISNQKREIHMITHPCPWPSVIGSWSAPLSKALKLQAAST